MGFFDLFKRKKTATLFEEDLKWNKMWELWSEGKADSPYAELMTYQSEINNGGHSQYFTNVENMSDLQKEMTVLCQYLSSHLSSNLRKAYEAYLLLEKNEENENAEKTLELCDDVFYSNEAEIDDTLRSYASGLEL